MFLCRQLGHKKRNLYKLLIYEKNYNFENGTHLQDFGHFSFL